MSQPKAPRVAAKQDDDDVNLKQLKAGDNAAAAEAKVCHILNMYSYYSVH